MAKIAENADIATVALASLTKMISLLSAELVVGSHSDDIDILESCIRAKLFASVDGVSPQDTAAGVALAHRLVEPVLRDLRTRLESRTRENASDEVVPVHAAATAAPPKKAGASRRLH